MSNREIRVRFAPSPTGPLHMGGVRTALYNYLFAKKNNGKFILRIEDTDQTRFVPGAEEYIIESFDWCGIQFDEGVTKGGPFGPYKQSERKAIYREFAEKLVADGSAYYAFDTSEELAALRKRYEAGKKTFTYNAAERNRLKNSLTLSEKETLALLQAGMPYVIRFKMPENRRVKMTDLIRGEVEVQTSVLDDKILFKSDGMPTYHLANVVDDHLMKISHVIRGEEWLPSLPLHVLLYEAFGWEAPQFAHLPLLLKPDGKGKLSKRDGDRLGFPVFPLQWTDPNTEETTRGYREEGYFRKLLSTCWPFWAGIPAMNAKFFLSTKWPKSFPLTGSGNRVPVSTPKRPNGSTISTCFAKATKNWPDCLCPYFVKKELSPTPFL